MSRGKSMSKSGWRARDKKYRLEQNAKAAANRAKRAVVVQVDEGPVVETFAS